MVSLRVGRRKDPTRRQVEMLGRWLVREVGLRDEAERKEGARQAMAVLVDAVVALVSRTPITRAPLYHDAMALALTVDNGLEYCYCPPMPPPPALQPPNAKGSMKATHPGPQKRSKGLFGKKKGASAEEDPRFVWELCVVPVLGNEWDNWAPPPPPSMPTPQPQPQPTLEVTSMPLTASELDHQGQWPGQEPASAGWSPQGPAAAGRGGLRRTPSKYNVSEPSTPMLPGSRPGTPKSVRWGEVTARGLQEVGGQAASPSNDIVMARFRNSTMLTAPAQGRGKDHEAAPLKPTRGRGKHQGSTGEGSARGGSHVSGAPLRPGVKRGLWGVGGFSLAPKRPLSIGSGGSKDSSSALKRVKKLAPVRPRRVPGWACVEADVIMLQAGVRGHVTRCKVSQT